MRTRAGGIAAAALLAAFGVALLAAQPTGASIIGNCTASLNGTDITHLPADEAHAIAVGKNDVVPMQMTGSGRPFGSLRIELAFAGFHWKVYNASAGGGTWSHNIDVNSFAKYGVGLYQVQGTGDFEGVLGGCTGIAMVKVSGNPLSTVAGLAGVASAAVGTLGVVGAGLAAGGGGGSGGGGGGDGGRAGEPYTADDAKTDEARERKNREFEEAGKNIAETHGWCWLFAIAFLPLLLLFGTGALLMAIAAPAVQVRRRTWPFVVGPLGGLLTGLGAGVLLQEYAVVYPTRTWGVIYLAGGIAFGLAVPFLRRGLARR